MTLKLWRLITRSAAMSLFSRYLGLLSPLVALKLALASTAPQTTVQYHDGDLFLGFRATGGTGATQDYLVNIGQPGQFVNQNARLPSLWGPCITDLNAVFGPDWYTRIDPNTGNRAVLWGMLVADWRGWHATCPANTLYATNPSQTPWPRRSNSNQAGITSLTDAMGTTYDGNMSTNNNPMAIVQKLPRRIATPPSNPAGLIPCGISFQEWNPTIEGLQTQG